MVRPPDRHLLDFLAVEDRSVGPLALALREIVLEEAPDAVERVFRNHPSALWYGCGPTMKDMFCYIAMASNHVTLGFCRGASLPDPAEVFEGAGRVMCHVKFKTERDLNQPFVRQYIRAALVQFQARSENPAR